MFDKLEDLAKNNKKISDFHIRAGSPLAIDKLVKLLWYKKRQLLLKI